MNNNYTPFYLGEIRFVLKTMGIIDDKYTPVKMQSVLEACQVTSFGFRVCKTIATPLFSWQDCPKPPSGLRSQANRNVH